ncbi:RNA polymerase sigma-70 factor (ECF subfamily) [Hamadaea flava]|uniref:RNA polymerase sigma factor n=1 Tax=Hamadaea flava TaxID=1742688 RepID=A0ABV8LXG9_9ACTN|nr:RNA polymerase sigma factor [Hamadaea flava]MCP2327008.1 RNA polymerase sigma-70 factor (ECF subfamily) [Hamadaea flava]
MTVEVESDAAVLAASVVDVGQFATVYDRHVSALLRYAASRMGAETAEDLVSETFLVAFRLRARFDQRYASARPWLLGILTNMISRHRRRERAYLRQLDALAAPRPVDWQSELVDELAADAVRPAIRAALARVPARDRDALLLVVVGELSYAEAAEAMRVPIGTIRSRVSRARQRLRRLLGDVMGQAGGEVR